MNAFIALCTSGAGYPSLLADAGYRLAGVEVPVAVGGSRVVVEGGCGNTVARLASNLQHHFDGALRMVDEGLDVGLRVPA